MLNLSNSLKFRINLDPTGSDQIEGHVFVDAERAGFPFQNKGAGDATSPIPRKLSINRTDTTRPFRAHHLGHANEQMTMIIYSKCNMSERIRQLELKEPAP
jgi:hypothetical protein